MQQANIFLFLFWIFLSKFSTVWPIFGMNFDIFSHVDFFSWSWRVPTALWEILRRLCKDSSYTMLYVFVIMPCCDELLLCGVLYSVGFWKYIVYVHPWTLMYFIQLSYLIQFTYFMLIANEIWICAISTPSLFWKSFISIYNEMLLQNF